MTESLRHPLPDCMFCGETLTIEDHNFAPGTASPMHRECGLRSVMGGIGHHLDHAHFCGTKQDPDAGLDLRTSAQMVHIFIARRNFLSAPTPEMEALDDDY